MQNSISLKILYHLFCWASFGNILEFLINILFGKFPFHIAVLEYIIHISIIFIKHMKEILLGFEPRHCLMKKCVVFLLVNRIHKTTPCFKTFWNDCCKINELQRSSSWFSSLNRVKNDMKHNHKNNITIGPVYPDYFNSIHLMVFSVVLIC